MQKLYTLITGASSGIGACIAGRLSEERNLILMGRDRDRLEGVRTSCCNSANHLVLVYDLLGITGIESTFSQFLLANQCGIDCFIHSAGVVKILPLRAIEYDIASAIMATNFFSAFELIRILVKKKINLSNLRNVTLISSAASKVGEKGNSIYAASKGAIDALTKSLAVELAPNIRVNAVLPGLVRTKMSDATFQDDANLGEIEKRYPLGLGAADDIASFVKFIISDEARWITGQHLIVDGGRTCQ